MNGQLNPLGIHIFPVLNNGTIVSLFYAAKDMNDEWFVQLSSEFVETLHEIAGGSEFALVYDRNGRLPPFKALSCFGSGVMEAFPFRKKTENKENMHKLLDILSSFSIKRTDYTRENAPYPDGGTFSFV